MEFQQQNPSIMMLPWLAEGHISPYLQLAKKLSARNFIIYFCLTPINLDSIRKSGNVQVEPSSIQLIYLHLPSPSQLPPQHHTTRSLPPHLFPFLIPAFDAAKPNFSNILSTFKPNLVIYDFLQPWAAAAANEQDVESVMFLTTGADGISSAVHYFKNPTWNTLSKRLNSKNIFSNGLVVLKMVLETKTDFWNAWKDLQTWC
ncbi:flavanone 7-O-glucoside 2''-O-beta-L-rhamnosyltransferase-like [Gossypium hirsutum]|uniref:Flavanone 7-O-glucoside 2''-O-beta-L-rhamnosyltransferase-like n=1 Tax=Gossypium hirsutum TaxID=3635 RepID=A0ABM2YHL0_GOSHI|nr:flavanone 7-O-glucoside 2''-O-beta-L-rhamnosyltransferase-like [Gossypium hirsutum]